jgi:hypothetical protein
VLSEGVDQSRVYARNHSFGVGRAASYRESDVHPSAIEQLLGALGGDLMSGWQAACSRAGLVLEAAELTIGGRLANPLRQLGVVGESGDPGIAAIHGTLYVSAPAEEARLRALWREVLEASPLHATLGRAVKLDLELRIVP